jgi:hypothetical protein
MEPIADARQEAGLEIQKLAEDFEKEDEAGFDEPGLPAGLSRPSSPSSSSA